MFNTPLFILVYKVYTYSFEYTGNYLTNVLVCFFIHDIIYYVHYFYYVL